MMIGIFSKNNRSSSRRASSYSNKIQIFAPRIKLFDGSKRAKEKENRLTRKSRHIKITNTTKSDSSKVNNEIKRISSNGTEKSIMTDRSTQRSRRGHQHHPKNIGFRSNVPTTEIIKALREGRNLETLFTHNNPHQSSHIASIDLSALESSSLPRIGDIICDQTYVYDNQELSNESKIDENLSPSTEKKDQSRKTSKGSEIRKKRPKSILIDSNDVAVEEDDEETAELAKLRCTSERTEVIAERENRRHKKCADYPGLAFGRSIFSSDSMMKFNIIRNELQNIMNNQLKRQGTLLDVLKKKMRQTKEEMERYKDECEEFNRKYQLEAMRREEAESEVAALNRRIQLLEEDLERSEERLASATAKLSEASAAADESERIRKALENRTNMEDDRVAILEAQLAQAKLIAEEADKKYEEVARKLVLMEQDLERSEEKVELSESKIVELEEELRVVGNNLKSLEVSEEKANASHETVEAKVHQLNDKLSTAEARAEFAERSVQKLQKEVDRLEDELLNERAKNKMLQEEMEATLHDIQNM